MDDFDFGLEPNFSDASLSKLAALNRLLPKVGGMVEQEGKEPALDETVESLAIKGRYSISSLGSLASNESIDSSSDRGSTESKYYCVPTQPSRELTALATRDDGVCAISNSNDADNLLIYEAWPDSATVTLHQTITLPGIRSMTWVPPSSDLGQAGSALVTGHDSGLAHLTLLPDPTVDTTAQAEILKRYNHGKHLRFNLVPGSTGRVKHVELTGSAWTCCAPISMVSLCSDHLFVWELNRSDVPLVMQHIKGVNCLSLSTTCDSIYALGRRRGMCIRDLRTRDRTNNGLKPAHDNDDAVSLIKWNPMSETTLAAVHDRTTIKVWDIRANSPLATYQAHADKICSIDWLAPNEMVSASADGTIRLWDIDQPQSIPLQSPSLGSKSPYKRYRRRCVFADQGVDSYATDLIDCLNLHRTPDIKANRSHRFLSMGLIGTGALSIDSANCLGLHQLHCF